MIDKKYHAHFSTVQSESLQKGKKSLLEITKMADRQ